MNVEERKAVVRRMMRLVWNEGELAAIEEFYPAECALHDVCVGGDYQGWEGVKSYIAGMRRAFPDAHVDILEQVGEADKVVTRWVFTGTHEGDIMIGGDRVDGTGKEIRIEGITFDDFVGDDIHESWIYREPIAPQLRA